MIDSTIHDEPATLRGDVRGFVTDHSVQILDRVGISDETPVGMIFFDMCTVGIYDGPTEVPRYAIARQVLRSPR